MTRPKIDQSVLDRANLWLTGNFDEQTKEQVRELMKGNPSELTDSFYRDLEFGTGGLRGIMGPGTNRMNKYTVGMATQGLANYLKKMFPDANPVRMVISFDSRNNSCYFARICAEVLSANGFRVFLFDDLRPTPELSFAIRHLRCQSGIMITASHNPKEYNGYKAYWDDGAQMISPHDINVIEEVKKIRSVDEVQWSGNESLVTPVGSDVDVVYLEQVKALSLSSETVQKHKGLKIVYTPLHGAGYKMVPAVLRSYGFENVTVVAEQAMPDGNFPTVHSPNPEEPTALELALGKAEETGADLVMATDPDADRVGIAVRDNSGKFVLLNGNQTAALLFYYVLTRWREKRMLTGREYIVKTIVTSELLSDIANHFGVEYFDCLTGFKYIADVIRRNEGKKTYVIGGEESFGYLVGDFVRDKDAVSACAMIAEACAWMAGQGGSLFDLLLKIYRQFGFYREQLLSVTRKGKSGAEEIQQMMVEYRSNPVKEIHGSRVVKIRDYQDLTEKDLVAGTVKKIGLPESNVLQFFLEDGSKISVRPSGTEPKIKFYFSARENLADPDLYDETDRLLRQKTDGIISSMKLH
jgi:phosphoglucomutase